MSAARRQRGVALFTVVFLIVAVGGLAVSLALISGQQQIATVQALDQTQAYYAARARLDREIAALLPPGTDNDTCPAQPGTDNVAGFTTVIDRCVTTTVDEGGATYDIYELEVRAFRGSAAAGTLVQRSIGVQVTDAP